MPKYALARVTSALVGLTLAAGTVGLTAGSAQAQSVGSGSLSFSGDAGDYISGGGSYSYSTDAQDGLTVSANTDNGVVSVSVTGANGDWWSLDLAAPSGQALRPGAYTDANRYPFNGTGPGLDLSGNGRGCNTLTGSFTVDDLAFGPNGYVQTLDASFEQHCEGDAAAARGEVHIHNPAPPEQLDLGVAVAVNGTAGSLNGNAAVRGTVTCNQPVDVTVSGNVTQVKKKVLIRGPFSTSVACRPGAEVTWTAQAVPTGTTPFQKGDVEVQAQASATDPNYGGTVTAGETTAVHLSRD
ncbi:hypothetical protein QQY24_10005 [Streptomyces sp. TG1A-8]|uniref:hypothetical protein n=1 Tax=Streptomyces sp. TG1A-8 TaxID=3051385 RepID=UPI00265B9763|nr:hypothetical protein [Streptomyces sp. TG1A-8]MDO0925729.1 hypothetical protein [Streptomyces sp. TG1A-8]